ncbi:hypothetical protein [Flagellimonas sp. 2504JD4-2]
MKTQSTRTSGISLLIGSFLMFVTMLLHPGEGGFTQGMTFALISHSLAIGSVPFSAVGFFGLANVLGEKDFLSKIGLAIMLLGLFAAVMAASFNGLALPLFIKDVSLETARQSGEILSYNRALNHSFDYILIAGMFISTFLWSLAIWLTKVLPRWLAYLGITLFVIGVVAVISGFYFLNVSGFRILIYGWVIWIVGAGIAMLKLERK